MKAVLLITGLAATIGLSLLGVRLGDSMPQLAKGEGVLSVAFGDARATISRAMVHKADSYFHGGVDMECTEHHDEEEGEKCSECSDVRTDRMNHEGCHHHHEAEHHHEHLEEGCNRPEHSNNQSFEQSNISFWDPWRWINTHIRAPEVERHLEGEKAVELMPWFWAAVKADPHNIDAWTTAIYMAEHTMKDDKLARRVIDEAKRTNPDSLDVLVSEGKFVYKRGSGDLKAAEGIFIHVRDAALTRCGNELEKLSENDRWAYKFALNYLSAIQKKKLYYERPTAFGSF